MRAASREVPPMAIACILRPYSAFFAAAQRAHDSSSVGCRILFPTPVLDEAVGAVNLCRDFNVGHHVVSSFSGGSLRSSARYLDMYLKSVDPLRPPIVRRQFGHRHHPLPSCGDRRPGTISTARIDFPDQIRRSGAVARYPGRVTLSTGPGQR